MNNNKKIPQNFALRDFFVTLIFMLSNTIGFIFSLNQFIFS